MRGAVALVVPLAALLLGVSRPAPSRDECDAERMVPSAEATSSELRLVLNVPAYRLDVIERGAITRQVTVAVGRPRYPTPIGRYAIDYVVWNPWWYPPPRWWARHEHITAPGWTNPVGRVKLHVTEMVFLHGSPLEQSLGSASSHACVRMKNGDALALARLVHRYGSPTLPPATLDSLEADTTATRSIPLATRIPIETRYDLVETLGDDLVVHPDIYARGPRVATLTDTALAVITRAGRDTSGIRRAALSRVVRDGRRRHAVIAIDSLLASPAPVGAR